MKEVLNMLLRNFGLIFRTVHSKRKRIDGKQVYNNDGIILTLIHTVKIYQRLPVKLEPLGKTIDKNEDDINTMKMY